MLKRFLGDRAFYRSVFVLLIPMIVQQFITSFVSLLDNVMVGSLGTEAISAASIANTVLSVLMLSIFGGLSGVSIYGAQFFGKGDMDGMRHAFRIKVYFGVFIVAAACLVYHFRGESFILSFLQGNSDGGDLELTLREGYAYMEIMLLGQLPFVFVQIYAGTLRESGETVAPMVAGICAIVTNLFLNWVLIFGHLGMPALGVRGAAIATVISRFLEMGIVVIHAHRHADKYRFLFGAYRGVYVPGALVRRVIPTAAPLLANEILWALGMTFISQL